MDKRFFKIIYFFRIFSINVNSVLFEIGLSQKLFQSRKIFALRLFKTATNQNAPGLNRGLSLSF